MALLIAAPNRDTSAVVAHLKRLDPELDVRVWPELGDPAEIDFVVLWNHPRGLLGQLPALKAASSYGAGTERILADPDLPADLPVGRLAGPRLAVDMAGFLAGLVIGRHRGLFGFHDDQRRRRWRPWAPDCVPVIGLLGTGRMGECAAGVFRALAFTVLGWNRSGRGPAGMEMFHGDTGLEAMAGRSDYLICLLPLTSATRGLLDHELFSAMRPGSCLINVGRGEHLVEADLLAALKQDRPGYAFLDVFSREPLPGEHPFWSHPKVFITPHCASYTLPEEAATLMLESYRSVCAGGSPRDLVDPDSGY